MVAQNEQKIPKQEEYKGSVVSILSSVKSLTSVKLNGSSYLSISNRQGKGVHCRRQGSVTNRNKIVTEEEDQHCRCPSQVEITDEVK